MKKNKILIETPEKIYFSYEIAGIGTRAAAYSIDLLIQTAILIIMALMGLFGSLNQESLGNQALLATTVLYLLIFFFQWFYFVFFEVVLSGSTPGKKICKIRVIKNRGERLDLPSIVLRNLLRAADSIPFPLFNILGGFVALINKRNKRLGDMVSGTIVVVDEGINIEEPDFTALFISKERGLITKLRRENRLTEKDLYILRKILNDRSNNPKGAQTRAEMIVEKLKTRYDLSLFKNYSCFEIIEEVYKAHTYEDS